MKNYLPIIVLLVLISCKKDAEIVEPVILSFNVGNLSDITLTNHDSIAQGYYLNQFPFTDYVSIDLDADGINDLQFSSVEYFLDHAFDFNNPEHYSIKVELLNEAFSLAEIEGSEQIYEHYSEPTFDFDGVWPRKTTIVNYACNELPNASLMTTHSTVNYLDFNSPITQQLSWDNHISELIIREPKFETLSYEGNQGPMGGDSLIGFHNIVDRHCQSMPLNTQYYIPFKKTIGSQYKYGWIKIDITDNNKIRIFESAIQNDFN